MNAAEMDKINALYYTYYKHNIEGKERMDGDGFTPYSLDMSAPITERFMLIKRYRILLYKPQFREQITKMFITLEFICNKFFFPLFFVLDFEQYQTSKEWKIDGRPIKNIEGVFYRYALARRERMKESGAWKGHEMRNYDFCGAFENVRKDG